MRLPPSVTVTAEPVLPLLMNIERGAVRVPPETLNVLSVLVDKAKGGKVTASSYRQLCWRQGWSCPSRRWQRFRWAEACQAPSLKHTTCGSTGASRPSPGEFGPEPGEDEDGDRPKESKGGGSGVCGGQRCGTITSPRQALDAVKRLTHI